MSRCMSRSFPGSTGRTDLCRVMGNNAVRGVHLSRTAHRSRSIRMNTTINVNNASLSAVSSYDRLVRHFGLGRGPLCVRANTSTTVLLNVLTTAIGNSGGRASSLGNLINTSPVNI